MSERRYETTAAFHELLEVLAGADRLFLEGPRAVPDETSVLEGYRWIPSLLAVALDAYVWADPTRPLFSEIVGPHRKWGGDNADAFYCFAPLDPQRRYRVRVEPGDAVYLSLTVYGGPRDGRYSDRIVGSLNDRQLGAGADGAYEITLGPEPGGAGHLVLEPDAVCAITRDYLVDPERGRRARWQIEPLDPAPPPRLTDADLAARFRAAATFLRDQLSFQPLPFDEEKLNCVDPPYPVPQVTRGWAAGDAAYAMGAFDLAPDEVLLVHGRSPACAFWNLCLWNPFLHTYDYRHERVTLNGGQVAHHEDGSWTIAIAARDPGVPNWVSTADHRRGRIWLRWFLPEATPDPLACRRVRATEAKRALEDLRRRGESQA